MSSELWPRVTRTGKFRGILTLEFAHKREYLRDRIGTIVNFLPESPVDLACNASFLRRRAVCRPFTGPLHYHTLSSSSSSPPSKSASSSSVNIFSRYARCDFAHTGSATEWQLRHLLQRQHLHQWLTSNQPHPRPLPSQMTAIQRKSSSGRRPSRSSLQGPKYLW
jgi:hypothetical protein